MPPDAPEAGEELAAADIDPVATRCAAYADAVRERTGVKLLKVVITTSPRWGTVWRADSAFPGSPGAAPNLWRTVCWDGGVLERPLQMFDPRQSIPAL